MLISLFCEAYVTGSVNIKHNEKLRNELDNPGISLKYNPSFVFATEPYFLRSLPISLKTISTLYGTQASLYESLYQNALLREQRNMLNHPIQHGHVPYLLCRC